MNRKWSFAAGLGVLGLLGAGLVLLSMRDAAPEVPTVNWRTDTFGVAVPAGRDWQPVRVRSGGTFSEALYALGVSDSAVRSAALEHYDLSKIRPDRDLQVGYPRGSDQVDAVRYRIDDDHALTVVLEEGEWRSTLDEITYAPEPVALSFTLTRSLWLDGLDAGLRPMDLVRLAEVFEYELDFNSELREGARFVLVADRLVPEDGSGAKPKLGEIYAVRLENGGTVSTAVRWTGSDGKHGYWHPDGTAMRRPFLRSPLEFSRVTSGYNPKRFHPILKKARPHNGTDFGAPTGTPVRAVGDATVELAGPSGGHGNFVKLDHHNGIETSYSHLSRIRVKKGAQIKQGDIVGEVGTTGMSTGPHLHYQMWRNGKYVDAMREPLPTAPPLGSAQRGAFLEAAKKRVAELDAAP